MAEALGSEDTSSLIWHCGPLLRLASTEKMGMKEKQRVVGIAEVTVTEPAESCAFTSMSPHDADLEKQKSRKTKKLINPQGNFGKIIFFCELVCT